VTHPVKVNANSGIYHVPGGQFYERTKAERCYVDAAAAEADGYRAARRTSGSESDHGVRRTSGSESDHGVGRTSGSESDHGAGRTSGSESDHGAGRTSGSESDHGAANTDPGGAT